MTLIGYDTGREGNYIRIHRDLTIVNTMRIFINLPELTENELYGAERQKFFGYTKYLLQIQIFNQQ